MNQKERMIIQKVKECRWKPVEFEEDTIPVQKKKRRDLRITFVVCFCLAASLSSLGIIGKAYDASVPATMPLPETPAISAENAILMDEEGRILFEKNSCDRGYPASTTKIMTALVTLKILEEQGLPIDSEVIVPEEAVGVEGSSIYLKKGERLTIEELLYGMMLQSGNDAATAIATCIGGNLQTFVVKMNEEAARLNCSGTHFTNPSGLFDENHFTTARDLALITAEAMKKEEFRQIVGSPSWKSERSGRNFYNKNKTVHQYEGATGVKIGFTKASGRTLVASAKRDGRELIAVVLRDGNWFNDAYAMMDYGFVLEKGDVH